jgi:hypothetical protein
MGTCCASRSDIDGKEKTNQNKKSETTLDNKSTPAVKLNAMDEVRNTIIQVLNDTANHEILVLNVPMDGFAAFCTNL